MCPVCLATLGIAALTTTSTGTLATLAVRKVVRGMKATRNDRTPNGESHGPTQDRHPR